MLRIEMSSPTRLLQQVARLLDADEILGVLPQHMGQVPGEHLLQAQAGTAGTLQAILMRLLHPARLFSRHLQLCRLVGDREQFQLRGAFAHQQPARPQASARDRDLL